MTQAEQNERDDYMKRWSKALWQSQIDAGLCTTPEPVTDDMKALMQRATEAAVNAAFDG